MDITRRKLIAALASAPIAANLPLAYSSQRLSYSADSILRDYEDWIVFDGLGSVYDINALVNGEKYNPKISERLANAVRQSGLTCMRQTTGLVFPDDKGDVFERCVKVISNFQQWTVQNASILTLVRSVEDIYQAKRDKKLAVTFGFQNSFSIEDRLDRIATFRNLGVLTMQLTYNGQNQIGGGANVSGKIPLSKLGHSIVEEMNAQKVLIDLSHGGEQTTLDAIRASKSPVTISHTGCRALVDIPRNKTDQELRLLAEKGGVAGIYFMPFLAQDSNATSEHLVQHIEHAVNVCGEDHVALGTDGGYTDIDDLEKTREYFNKFTSKRIKEGNAAAGEKLGNVNFLPDIVGREQFRKLAVKLSKRGHSSARIEKLFGANSIRLFREVWEG